MIKKKTKSKRKYWIKKIDKLVSLIVRERAGWKCERCGTQYTPPTKALHCSHYFSRRHIGTRFVTLNLCALCYGCHKRWEGMKQDEYKEFMIERIGEDALKMLEDVKNTTFKVTDEDLEIIHTNLLDRSSNKT